MVMGSAGQRYMETCGGRLTFTAKHFRQNERPNEFGGLAEVVEIELKTVGNWFSNGCKVYNMRVSQSVGFTVFTFEVLFGKLDCY
jgi:hypothetical protein